MEEIAKNSSEFLYRKPMELLAGDSVIKVCAPMVRYSKLPFRKLVRKYDCDLTFTPMIISECFAQSEKAREVELVTDETDRPLIVQFAANNATTLANAAEHAYGLSDGVDLNCGCPQSWAMTEGYGAKLLRDPELIRDMVLQTRNRISDPDFTMSIKIRIHSDIRKTVDLCQMIEQAGVSWITVHGRTKDQRSEPVSVEAIKTIKDSVSIPVIANGDIKCMEDVETMVERTGVDGVMSARGILTNPALYAGYDKTPMQCVQDWLDICNEVEERFAWFHHHVTTMCEKILTKPERKILNANTTKEADLEFLQNRFGLRVGGIATDDIIA